MDVAYIRISTDSQHTARQDALMASLGITKIYTEIKSGRTAARPVLWEMIHALQPGDTLHVESISRLARSTKDLLNIVEQIEKRNANFVSHKESLDARTPQGKFTLTIFAALAELERETTYQRQAEGIAAAKAKGKYWGREKLKLPDNIDEIMTTWKTGQISCEEAAKMCGVSAVSLRRRSVAWLKQHPDVQEKRYYPEHCNQPTGKKRPKKA
jgi:DNA invertase Pin-like site-specific DNA recombinase